MAPCAYLAITVALAIAALSHAQAEAPEARSTVVRESQRDAPADDDIEYDVTFTSKGARLGLILNADLSVRAFHRDGSRPLAAEASGRIQIGDILASIKGGEAGDYMKTLSSVTLSEAQRMLTEAPAPKKLRFRRPGGKLAPARKGALATAAVGIHGHTVLVDVSARSMPMVTLTGMQGMFGGPIKCQRGPVLFASPPHGCSAYTAPDAVRDAILLVERGACSFAHKAALAQQYNARGIIILNDEPGLLRMPDDPAVRYDTTLPAVLLSADDASRLHKYASHLIRSGVAVLRLAEQYCGTMEPNPRLTPVPNNAPPLPTAGVLVVMTEQQVTDMLPLGDTVRFMLTQRPSDILWTGALLHLLPHERVAKFEYAHAEFGMRPACHHRRLCCGRVI